VKTERDLMREAFAAVLRGDYAERDRLCAEAERLIKMRNNGPGFVKKAQERPIMVDMGTLERQPDGSFKGTKH